MKKTLLIISLFIVSINSKAQVSLPFTETFESGTFPPTGWNLNPAGSPSWVLDSTVSGYGIGTSCVSFDNFTNITGTFNLRLPQFSLQHAVLPFIRFDVAYAIQPSTVNSDQIGIWWSANGISTWQNLQNYSGNTLSTSAPIATPFVPAASDWRTTFFPLTYVLGQTHVYLQLQDICNGGNKVYIDNIRIFDSATVGINEPLSGDDIAVYPNPANERLVVENNSLFTKPVKFVLYNMLGEEVIIQTLTGKNNVIELSSLEQSVYVYKIVSENKVLATGKVIRN